MIVKSKRQKIDMYRSVLQTWLSLSTHTAQSISIEDIRTIINTEIGFEIITKRMMIQIVAEIQKAHNAKKIGVKH